MSKNTPTSTNSEPKIDGTLMIQLFELLDEYFPKGRCKERGQAMMLVTQALMIVVVRERRITLEAQDMVLTILLNHSRTPKLECCDACRYAINYKAEINKELAELEGLK